MEIIFHIMFDVMIHILNKILFFTHQINSEETGF